MAGVDLNLAEKVELFIACRGLPKLDYLSHTDAFAVLYGQNRAGRWEELGRTETIDDTEDPDFTHQFELVSEPRAHSFAISL